MQQYVTTIKMKEKEKVLGMARKYLPQVKGPSLESSQESFVIEYCS